jgi:hypothetical protein
MGEGAGLLVRMAKLPVRRAFLAAIPIEAVNFVFAMFPIDVGFAPDTSWYRKAAGYEWLFLHWPGLWLSSWIVGTRFEWLEPFLWAAGGYIDTALVIIGGILAIRLLRQIGSHQRAAKTTL